MSHQDCGADVEPECVAVMEPECAACAGEWKARADSGSAIAEFALIGSLLALVLAGTLQVGLVIHVRNTVIDSAIAGARQASLADQSMADGERLASELITVSVGERYAQSITVTTAQRGQVDVVEVRVRTPLPVLGLWGPAEVWGLSGRSIVEDVDRD